MRRKFCFTFGIIFLLLFIPQLGQAENKKFIRRQKFTADLTAAIAVVAPAKQKKEALRAINRALTRGRHVLSLIDERKEGSETYLLNRHAGGTPIKAGRQLLYLLSKGAQLSELTGGVFDLTLGSKSRKVSYRDIWIDPVNSLAAIRKKRGRVSVWAIIRGYLADGMAKTIREQGFENFLINVGGKLRVSGKDIDGSWIVGIQDPLTYRGDSVCRLSLMDQGLATSSYQSYRVDLESKVSSPAFASVSVIAPDALTADALSHAGMLMGTKAYSLFQGISGVGVVFVTGSGEVHKVGRVAAACFSR